MDPQIVGAIIGLGGAVVGGYAARSGAATQARGQVEAMRMQVASARDDAMWARRQAALVTYAGVLDRLSKQVMREGVALAVVAALRPEERAAGLRSIENPRTDELLMEGMEAWAAVRLALPGNESERARTALLKVVDASRQCTEWRNSLRRITPGIDPALHRAAFEASSAASNTALSAYLDSARQYLDSRGAEVVATPTVPWWQVWRWHRPWR
ncbi:hypothetical protein GCM10010193_70390 [Kitasatospora atroaurantiaca]|uniref:hypothetical protein n=1 Tax=Kitasatospora atroaurantiaca TaxID=285545 RepID=UPI0011A77766|nr:hypothetical protein [Kitasatospora atroaurantiaca]